MNTSSFPPGPLLIAIDADGVLLDYNRTFGRVYGQHFQQEMFEADPSAYHATRYWGIQNPARGDAFWDAFDQDAWRTMEPMPGALDACLRLHAAGHRLVCVTSMPPHRQAHRLENLKNLGFPIDEVIATGTPVEPGGNPKKAAIDALQPDLFVDDELRKLRDLPTTRCILVDPGHSDCPNRGQADDFLVARLSNLSAVADWLLGPASKPALPRP